MSCEDVGVCLALVNPLKSEPTLCILRFVFHHGPAVDVVINGAVKLKVIRLL